MKLERNKNIYQIIDKSIDEIESDLRMIEIDLDLIKIGQNIRNIGATITCTLGVGSAINYFYTDENHYAIGALLWAILALRNIYKGNIADYKIKMLNEKKEVLTKAKIKKLTR